MLPLSPVVNTELRPGQFVPPMLEPLVASARRGDDLAPQVAAIVRSYGFDSFEYGVSTSARPDRLAANHFFSTVPQWTLHYGRKGYVESDPRVFLTCRSSLPILWDQGNVRGLGPRVDAFLDDARAHGIASGVSFMWRGPFDAHHVVALNACVELYDDIRRNWIMRNLSEIALFGRYFHEIFMARALPFRERAEVHTDPLSTRERECLALAANGMTTKDISHKLDISSRTVQFHFEKIYTKLRASNRQEAVARAVQSGIVRTM